MSTVETIPMSSPDAVPRRPGTQWPQLFAALAAEFDRAEVKLLNKGKTQLRYITARTAMIRLDEVLGPENWTDKLTMLSDDSFLCELTITLPNGQKITKCDVGGMAGMSDKGDDDKSGASDAFKRAAAKFGVARYLYRDGVPDFGGAVHTPEEPPPDNKSGYGRGQYASPKQVEDYERRVKAFVDKRNAEWLDEWTREDGQVAEGIKDLLRVEQVTGHMLKWSINAGKLQPLPEWIDPETREVKVRASTEKAKKYAAIVFAREPESFADEINQYARDEAAKARVAWREKFGPKAGEDDGEWQEGRE